MFTYKGCSWTCQTWWKQSQYYQVVSNQNANPPASTYLEGTVRPIQEDIVGLNSKGHVSRWANFNSQVAMQAPSLLCPVAKRRVCPICLQWLQLFSSRTLILFYKSYSWYASNHLPILPCITLGLFGKRLSCPVSGIFSLNTQPF